MGCLGRTKIITKGDRSLVDTSSLVCYLNHFSSDLSTSLLSGFRNRFVLDPFCSKALTNSVLFFQIIWTVKFTRSDSLPMSTFSFPSYISCIIINFSSTHKTFLLFVTEDMLPRYQSPVKSSSRNVEDNNTHKVRVYYRYCCYFPVLETIQLPERGEGLSSQGRGGGRNLQIIYLLENYNGTDDWQCRYIRGT